MVLMVLKVILVVLGVVSGVPGGGPGGPLEAETPQAKTPLQRNRLRKQHFLWENVISISKNAVFIVSKKYLLKGKRTSPEEKRHLP